MNRTALLRRSHATPGFVAAIVHRLSGLALTIFLPLHFLALGMAVAGADHLDSFLALTHNPVVMTLEWGLVVALSVHLACGLRVLVIEFLPSRENTAAVVAACFAVALAGGLLFLLSAGAAGS
jgi:fumarate reductase subunit D